MQNNEDESCNKLKMYYTPRELLDVIGFSLANKDAQQGIIKGKGVSGVIIQFKHSMLVTIMESLKQLIDEGYTS